MNDQDESYSKEETQRRFEASIRGARTLGHKSVKAEPRRPRKKKAEGDAPAVSRFKGKHPISR